jgi:hypothetical protein
MAYHPPLHRKSLALGAKSIRDAKLKLPPPPSQYKVDSYYRVHLGKAVELSDGVWARPIDDVVMTGASATEIADSIIAAEEVASPKA